MLTWARSCWWVHSHDAVNKLTLTEHIHERNHVMASLSLSLSVLTEYAHEYTYNKLTWHTTFYIKHAHVSTLSECAHDCTHYVLIQHAIQHFLLAHLSTLNDCDHECAQVIVSSERVLSVFTEHIHERTHMIVLIWAQSWACTEHTHLSIFKWARREHAHERDLSSVST